MEENVEKKSTKKGGLIAIIIAVLLIIAVVIGGVIYLNSRKKPEKIFANSIESVFKTMNNKEVRKERVELELSAEINADDPQIRAMNEILKAVKLKSTTEVDLDKKILNQNILATYNNEQIVSLDALVQNEKAYIYLKDLYSKYIEVNEEYLEGMNLSTIFETSTKTADEKLVKDVKQIILDEVKTKELKQEKVTLNNESVIKTTLKLTPKEVLEITVKVLKKINESEDIEDLKVAIENIEAEMEYMENTENYAEISIYTKGIRNNFVKVEVVLVDVDNDEVIALDVNKISKEEYKVTVLVNDVTLDINEANEVVEVMIKKEDENKGTIQVKINAEEVGNIILDLKYSIDYNANIETRNTSNSIDMNSFGEEDFNEIMTNAQNNEILYSIVQLIMSNAAGEAFIEQ